METKVFLEGRGFSNGNPGNHRKEGFFSHRNPGNPRWESSSHENKGIPHGNPGNLRMEGFSHVKTGTFHVNL